MPAIKKGIAKALLFLLFLLYSPFISFYPSIIILSFYNRETYFSAKVVGKDLYINIIPYHTVHLGFRSLSLCSDD